VTSVREDRGDSGRDTLMPLRIAQIAPLWTSLPPATYGGTELMVHLLTEELVRQGHDVTLFAAGDTTTAARLEAVVERHLIAAMADGKVQDYDHYAHTAIAAALERAGSFDVMHCHLGCAFVPFARVSPVPMVFSLGTIVTTDDAWVMQRHPDVLVSVRSRQQVAALARELRERVHVIANACDFSAFEPTSRAGAYLAFLGRMSPAKNPLGAIEIARRVDMPIVLAGAPITRDERDFFAHRVRPLIDGRRVHYVGPVNHAEKNELLRHAAALLFPVRWPEPFGIVMIEAMACGTPVVACALGAVPEVIEPGRTGYFADTIDELVALVPNALALDRRVVRRAAEERFSHTRMAGEYLDAYRMVLAGGGVARPSAALA